MILVDVSEPVEIVALLRQSAPVSVLPLNLTGRSDYYFGGEDSRSRQFSRKQAGELLSDLDNAERQLADYYDQASDNYQIVEGVISSVPLSFRSKRSAQSEVSIRSIQDGHALFAYHFAPNGFLLNEGQYKANWSMLQAWLFRLEMCGVRTIFTNTYVETAQAIVAIYKNVSKAPHLHNTLTRYIRPRINLQEKNQFVRAIVCLSSEFHCGVGETTANKLLDAGYTGVFDLAMADVDEVGGVIGRKTAEKLLTALGRKL